MHTGDVTLPVLRYTETVRGPLGNSGAWESAAARLSSRALGLGEVAGGLMLGFSPMVTAGRYFLSTSWLFVSECDSVAPGMPRWVCEARYDHDHHFTTYHPPC